MTSSAKNAGAVDRDASTDWLKGLCEFIEARQNLASSLPEAKPTVGGVSAGWILIDRAKDVEAGSKLGGVAIVPRALIQPIRFSRSLLYPAPRLLRFALRTSGQVTLYYPVDRHVEDGVLQCCGGARAHGLMGRAGGLLRQGRREKHQPQTGPN